MNRDIPFRNIVILSDMQIKNADIPSKRRDIPEMCNIAWDILNMIFEHRDIQYSIPWDM